MSGKRRRIVAGVGVVVAAYALSIAGGGPGVAILFICAVMGSALLINPRGLRHWAVEMMWSYIGRRRPDMTHGRLHAYIIGWSLVVVIAFVCIFLGVFPRHP